MSSVVPAKMRCKETECHDTYVWTIPNFSDCDCENLTSPTFPPGDDSFGWYLELYSGRQPRDLLEPDNWITLTFRRTKEAFKKYGPVSGTMSVEVPLSVKNSGANWRNEVDFDFKEPDSTATIYNFYMRGMLQPDSMMNRLGGFNLGRAQSTSSELKLHFKVKYTRFVPIEIPDSDATKDFEQYFNHKLSSNVAVYVGDKKYPVHTFVLAAHSPVFEAMFKKDKKRKRKTRQNYVNVQVQDIDEKTFEKLLRYMYTGKVDDLKHEESQEKEDDSESEQEESEDEVDDSEQEESNVNNSKLEESQSLFVAADKYGMVKLKARCEIEISRLLSVKTAVRILLFADTHNLAALKKWTIDFINAHFTEVKKFSDCWPDFCSRQNLLLEVLETESPETVFPGADSMERVRRVIKPTT